MRSDGRIGGLGYNEKCVELEADNKLLQKEKNILHDEKAAFEKKNEALENENGKRQEERILLEKKLQMKEGQPNGTLIMFDKIFKHNYFWKCLTVLIVTPIMIVSVCENNIQNKLLLFIGIMIFFPVLSIHDLFQNKVYVLI
jgi:hypothetical protein